jgi:hypothetical protein
MSLTWPETETRTSPNLEFPVQAPAQTQRPTLGQGQPFPGDMSAELRTDRSTATGSATRSGRRREAGRNQPTQAGPLVSAGACTETLRAEAKAYVQLGSRRQSSTPVAPQAEQVVGDRRFLTRTGESDPRSAFRPLGPAPSSLSTRRPHVAYAPPSVRLVSSAPVIVRGLRPCACLRKRFRSWTDTSGRRLPPTKRRGRGRWRRLG